MKTGKKSAFESGFDAPERKVEDSDLPWTFSSTGSPSLDKLVKDHARPKPWKYHWETSRGQRKFVVDEFLVNQEPCEEEIRVQRRNGYKADESRAAAIEARKAISFGRLPVSRDEAAEAIAQAFRVVYANSIGISEEAADEAYSMALQRVGKIGFIQTR